MTAWRWRAGRRCDCLVGGRGGQPPYTCCSGRAAAAQPPAQRSGQSAPASGCSSQLLSNRDRHRPSWGVVFWLRISPRIRSQNRKDSKCSVRDLCRTDLCKNPRKSTSLPCPFKSVDFLSKNIAMFVLKKLYLSSFYPLKSWHR